jgi:hypothetical protein
MLVTVSAFLIAATIPAFQQRAPASEVSGRDSTRLLRLAHRAQGDFESLRRRLLPRTTLTSTRGGCDAVVGRYCYVQDVMSTAPDEEPEVVAARKQLLGTLDSLGAIIPGDRWIVGQKVRYLIEAGRPPAADSVGIACAARANNGATKGWCLALVGYTAQQFGNYSRAEAAFTVALEEMPVPERGKWEDLALLLGRSAGPYRRADDAPRDSMTAAFWRLVQPLYLTTVNDLRTEFLARITRMYIEQDSRTAMSDWWRADDRETLLRYGVALWYAQGERRPGSIAPPEIAGIRRVPSFNFFPDAHVYASPDHLTPEDWELENVDRRPTYAPIWASSFQPLLDHQVALFRRGDSAFIVAAFDVNDDAAIGETRRAGAFAAVIDHGGVLPPIGATIEKAGLGVISTLIAPWRPMIISLEVLDPVHRAAGRMRFAPKLPLPGTRWSLSDLLLYSPRDSAPRSLTEVVPLALHALRAPHNRQIGIFWEAYGAAAPSGALDYSLAVEPLDDGLLQRALVKLHIKDPTRAVNLQWREVPSFAGAIAARGVTVDLSRLRPGQYRVRLMLTSGTDVPIVAERSIEVL